MKKMKRIVAILLAVLMITTIVPANALTVSAATNKATVTQPAKLKNVLEKKNITTVNIKTGKKYTFTTKAKKYKKTINLIASRSTFKNKAVFKKVNIKKINSYIEMASGNKLNVTAPKVKLQIAAKAKNTSISLNKKNMKVAVKTSGSVSAIQINKKADLKVSGKPKKELKIKNNAADSKITIDTASNVQVILNKKANVLIGKSVKGATIILATGSTATITNYSKKEVSVRQSNGNIIKVKAGQKRTVSNKTSSDSTKNGKDNVVPVKAWKVSFETKGGTEVPAQTVESGKKVVEPVEPSWDGFTFKGWYLDENFKNKYDFNSKVSEDFTLYAKWRMSTDSDVRHTVTFVLNDGSDGTYQQSTVINNNSVSRPLTNPSRVGYTFKGWYDDETLTAKYDFSSPVTSDITLYAGWGNPEGEDGLYASQNGGDTTYSISSLKVLNTKVEAVVNANTSGILVVRFYDPSGYFDENSNWSVNSKNCYGYLSVRTPAHCESSVVSIDKPSGLNLPTHYIVTASLYDSETTNELCDTYICANYTEENEEFEKLTVNDFKDETVLNFDKDKTDNFGVLADEVKEIKCTGSQNRISVKSQSIKIGGNLVNRETYTFSNPDDTVKRLKQGDKVLIYENGTAKYILEISNVSVSGGQISITESLDTDLMDFYSVLKVDMGVEEAKADDSGFMTQAEIIDTDTSAKVSLATNLEWKIKNGNPGASLKGELKGEAELDLSIKYDARIFRKDYFECAVKSNITGTFQVKLEGTIDNSSKVKKELEGVKVPFKTPIVGLDAYTAVSFPTEVSFKANVSVTLKFAMNNGFTYNSNSGRQDIDKKSYSVDFKGEAKFEVSTGPKFAVGVTFIKDKLDASIEAQIGVKLTAELALTQSDDISNVDSKHACHACLSGKARWFAKVNVKLKYKIVKDVLEGTAFDLNVISVEGYVNPMQLIPGGFYLSLKNDRNSILGGQIKFGWGACPNKKYRLIVKTVDKDNNEISGVALTIVNSNGDVVQSAKSQSKGYLYNGVYKVSGTIGDKTVSSSFVINEGAKNITLSEKSQSTTHITGKVRDADTKKWIDGATVKFNKGEMTISSATTSADGSFEADLPVDSYEIIVSKDGYVSVTTNETIVENETKYMGTIDLVAGDENGQGGFSGYITDAITGNAVQNVKLQIRAGANSPDTNDILLTLSTDSRGYYSYKPKDIFGIKRGLTSGMYTVTAIKDGYITSSFNIVVKEDEDVDNQNGTISPVLKDKEYRIVLRWGSRPSDLDSHYNAIAEADHVYYSHKSGMAANLDVDDTSSYGPETITVTNFDALTNGFVYSVHNYSNRSESSSQALSESDAYVTVYHGKYEPVVFHVPVGYVGTVWNVFKVNSEGNIEAINTFENCSDPSNVGSSFRTY